MKQILCLSFAQENLNYEEEVELLGRRAKLIHYSCNFDTELTESLIKKYDGVVDVICITGLPPKIKFKKGFFLHPDSFRIKTSAKHTPIVDGQVFKDVYIPWAMRRFYLKNPQFLTKKKIGFYTGALQKTFVEVLEELENKLIMADPYFLMKLPFTLNGNKSLEKFLKILTPVLKNLKIKKSSVGNFDSHYRKYNRALDEFLSSDILVGNEANISFLDLKHLKNKTLILDIVTPQFFEKLKEAGLKEAMICLPTDNHPFINYSIIEAFIQLRKGEGRIVKEDDIIWAIDELQLHPEVVKLNDDLDKTVRFAFVIHPLSSKYLFKHPLLKPVAKYSKPFEKVAEDLMALSPGFFYGFINGIVSEKNGRRVQGLIYTVTETPKKLVESEPEVVYKKILRLCEKADNEGAKIIGLGAYTKIVGDAGVTIARLSPIPVTTGNSLSAASTLWAAKLAVEKIDLVKKEGMQFKGVAMVIGATGSIGAVSAKVLALSWDEIIIVAPRAYKLLELKDDILKINPKVKIDISTKADDHTHRADLIITTTSSRGETILDIMKVKPGAVICDVSRPFDIKEEEAIQRPDVMVIASGEVQLPGHIDMKIDIGLEGNIVYACLAETALLAMEGKFESFTLSRNINYEKVLEIDRLSKEHGVRLSQIMGHNGFLTDEEFRLCRELALKKLNSAS